MNCQKCQQRPASIHIAQIVNGEKHETYLCEVCAQAEKITVEIPQLPIDNLKNLLGFLGQSYLTEQGSYQSVCKNCQTSYKKIYETGYVGCSECYDQFSSQLENVVQKIHGMQKHRGKIPNRLGASFRVKRDLEDLRLQLRQAVEREEYEKAAELRIKLSCWKNNKVWGRCKMMIDKIVSQPGSNWTKGDGSHNNIVISSRIRLARNIEKLPMPYLKNESSSFTVLEKTRLAYEELNLKEQGYEFYNMRDIPSLARQIMTEKHLISPEFAVAGINQGLIISADESVSIMINEEDHLRIQVLYSGLQLEEAWAKADKTDDLLESKLNYAFDEKKGYLTACPTNVGTGVRASVMVHLPALVLTKQAKRLFSTLNQLGLTVRGLYGEGTEAMGNFYQVSNRTTLGQKESEIIQNLTSVVLQITEEEEEIRQSLSKNTEIQLKDKVGRAIGTLKNAYILSSREALDLLSDVRLGQDLGIIDTGLTNQELTELIIESQPAFLQQYRGQSMEPLERDVTRAKLFKETLTKGGIK